MQLSKVNGDGKVVRDHRLHASARRDRMPTQCYIHVVTCRLSFTVSTAYLDYEQNDVT